MIWTISASYLIYLHTYGKRDVFTVAAFQEVHLKLFQVPDIYFFLQYFI